MHDGSQPEEEIPLEEHAPWQPDEQTGRLIEESEFRTALGHFASGITVITGHAGSQPAGLTCQSFFSVSLNPQLIGLCPSKSSTSWPGIAATGRFCVNVLSSEQEALARNFAVSGGDKFAGVGWSASPYGPHLQGSLCWIDCNLGEVHEAGDHLLVTGQVCDLEVTPKGSPLIFYRGGFGDFIA